MNLRDLFLRVRALLAPRQVERELDEELAFHIERETQKYISLYSRFGFKECPPFDGYVEDPNSLFMTRQI